MDPNFSASLMREQEDCGIIEPTTQHLQHIDANKTELEKNITRRTVETQTDSIDLVLLTKPNERQAKPVGPQTEPIDLVLTKPNERQAKPVEPKRKSNERQALYTEPVPIAKQRPKANTSRNRLSRKIAVNRYSMKRAKGGVKEYNKCLN